jgi:putative inorganic carbon (HCO3(-)) transporter
VLLLALAAFWLLLTLTDEASGGLTPIHLAVTIYWGVMGLATVLSPVRGAALAGLTKLTLNVLLFALVARVARHPQRRNGLVLAYLLTTLPVSIYGLRQYFSAPPPWPPGWMSIPPWRTPPGSIAFWGTRIYWRGI